MVAKELAPVTLLLGVCMYRYIDNILISGSDCSSVQITMDTMTTCLQSFGIVFPEVKGKKPAQEVTFLGICWIGSRESVPTEILSEPKAPLRG